MDKTIDAWPRRLFYLGIAAVMTLGLLLAPATTPQASAAEVNAEWDKVATPYTDDWTVAPNSNILIPASIAGGSVIYVVGHGHEKNDMSETYGPRLWKSEDSGVTWDDLADKVWDADNLPPSFNSTTSYLNYVACAGDDSDFVAVALLDTSAAASSLDYGNMVQAVVISDDGGDNFAWTHDITDSTANSTLDCIFSMVISNADTAGKRNIALGGVGTKGVTYPTGLVYRYETGGLTGGGWVDASDPNVYVGWDNINDDVAGNEITSVAVTKVKFAPSWLADKTILAVSHTTGETYLQSAAWGNSKCWNLKAGFEAAVEILGADGSIWLTYKGAASGLVLPSDYEGRRTNTRYAWVYVNNVAGDGIIYRVVNADVVTVAQQIGSAPHPYLTTISYIGTIESGKAIAGLMGDGTATDIGGGIFLPNPTDCCEGVQVYRNAGIEEMDICCIRWNSACKPPTGRLTAMAYYVLPNKAYAWVGGTGAAYEEGALSFSLDDGDTWNQVGLVDTYIDYLSDVAKSPNCNKTWVVSVNTEDVGAICGNRTVVNCAGADVDEVNCTGCDSLWLKADPLPEASEYSGAWIREWCQMLNSNVELNSAQTPEMGLVRLAPEETEEALTVYLVDRSTDKVYYENNEGLGCWEEGSSTIDHICDLAVQDEATIYALDFNADVAACDDHGAAASWSSTMDSKVDDGHTIAVLGEGNVLVGGADGKVSYSDSDLATFIDGEASFTKLDDIGDGRVHVAFDSYFDTNSVVYAAVSNVNVNVATCVETPDNDADNGIYRWVIDESSKWTDLGECTGTATPWAAQIGVDGCVKVDVGYYGIVLSNAEGNPKTDATTGGVLYAAFYDVVNGTTGVARCLNPAEEVACGEALWDYLIEGVAANAAFTLEPSSLKICGCLTPDTNSKLWAIDDHAYYESFANLVGADSEDSSVGRLWTYEDCYAKAGPVLSSPADNAVVASDPCYCWNDAFTLKWDRQCDACSYNLQISFDADFTEVLIDISGKYEDILPNDCTEIDYDPPSGTNPSYVVANMALGTGSCGTTFYWRVRSADAETGEIIHSWWSEVRSFTVAAGPSATVTLTNPSNGAIGVSVSNIPFTWDEVPSATSYEFSLVNAETDAEEVSATPSGTTYTYTGTLPYATSYYWTVKALKDTAVFGVATATFTTGAEGVVPPAPTTPAWVWVLIAIGAVLVIVTLVLIFRTRRV